MKKILLVVYVSMLSCYAKAQAEEIQQLLLNVEKLSQFKQILEDMVDGYKIIHGGYTSIKNISEGNFNLHQGFLEGLMEVSPGVRKYHRIAGIIGYQIRIVKEYKAAYSKFKQDKQFTLSEIEYMANVYGNLFKQSLKGLDDLVMVITAGTLRMSDEERLEAIDRIYNLVADQFSFLKDFNNNAALLAMQRKAEQTEIAMSRRINGRGR